MMSPLCAVWFSRKLDVYVIYECFGFQFVTIKSTQVQLFPFHLRGFKKPQASLMGLRREYIIFSNNFPRRGFDNIYSGCLTGRSITALAIAFRVQFVVHLSPLNHL